MVTTRPRRRPAALALASLLLAVSAVAGFLPLVPGPACRRACAAPLPGAGEGVGPAPRLPLVLVAGWGDDPAATWGTDRPGGLYAYLLRLGYRPGQDLLVLGRSPAGEGQFAPAVKRLEEAVDRARHLNSGRAVGLVAHGEGCLLCRLFLAASGAAGVELLAMIAPPNHGADWAGYLRLAAETERQGSSSRLQPPLGAGGPAADFASAGTYVDRRSRLVYEPLYRRYVLEGRLAGEPGRDEPGRPALFEAWLAQEQPQLWDENLLGAGRPPVGDPLPGPAALATPVQGRSLSRAFYEFLALNVARFRTLAGWSDLGEEVWGLVSSLLERWLKAPGRAPEGWAGETTTVLGRYLLDQAQLRAGSLAATRLAQMKGLDPWTPRLEALLPEELFLPGPGGVPVAVPLNQALRGFNRWESGARAAGDRGATPVRPRYVVITGRAAKPWTPAVQGRLGWSPDWEARSAVLEMAEEDALAAWDGSVSAGDLWLLYHPRVHRFLAEELVRPGRAGAAHRLAPALGAPAAAQGRLVVTPWETSYLLAEAGGAGKAGGAGEARGSGAPPAAVLELELDAPPPYCPALRLAAWLHLEGPDGGPLERRRLEPEVSADGSRLRLQLEGWGERVGRVRLGLRLEPAWGEAVPGRSGVIEPLPPLPEGTPLEVRYRLAAVTPAAPPSGSLAPGQGPDSPAGGGGDGAAPGPGPAPQVPGRQGPLIVVQRSDKRTTTRYERHTCHSRWEWDFGDGSTWVDPDPGHLVGDGEHTFAGPGPYTVRAVSVSNSGMVLRTGTWEVEVPPEMAGRPRAFQLETAREPEVRVIVEGPREWVTGRPADFTARVEIKAPPNARCRVTSIDPGAAFAVLWEHPGEYQVAAAATVQITYEFPEGNVTLWNTYLGSVTVVVLATSVSG